VPVRPTWRSEITSETHGNGGLGLDQGAVRGLSEPDVAFRIELRQQTNPLAHSPSAVVIEGTRVASESGDLVVRRRVPAHRVDMFRARPSIRRRVRSAAPLYQL